MITRAELLAQLHGEASDAVAEMPPIDLSDYAEFYGFELADLARRVLSLVRFAEVPRRLLELHPGGATMASGWSGPRVHAVESQPDAVRRLLTRNVEVTKGTWPEVAPEGRFDLVVAAGVMSRFSEHELANDCAGRLADLLAPQGQVLVLEQGNRLGGRTVTALRAGLLAHNIRPIAPCPHDGPCPLADHRRRWCSFPIREDLPEPQEGLEPGAQELSLLLAGRGAKPRQAKPFVLGTARHRDGAVSVRVCHEQFNHLIAPVSEHTRRGGGLYRQRRGTYVDVALERLEVNGLLIAGPALPPGDHLLDLESASSGYDEP